MGTDGSVGANSDVELIVEMAIHRSAVDAIEVYSNCEWVSSCGSMYPSILLSAKGHAGSVKFLSVQLPTMFSPISEMQ